MGKMKIYRREVYAPTEKIKTKKEISVWFGLVWFYGTSIIVGYLMPNPFWYMQRFI